MRLLSTSLPLLVMVMGCEALAEPTAVVANVSWFGVNWTVPVAPVNPLSATVTGAKVEELTARLPETMPKEAGEKTMLAVQDVLAARLVPQLVCRMLKGATMSRARSAALAAPGLVTVMVWLELV